MHELSIAQNIVEIVRARIPEEDLSNVRTLSVRIGVMAGVVPDSLEFCFSAIVGDTPIKNVRLEIESVPYAIHCTTCDRQTVLEYGMAICPSCGSPHTNVISGTELDLVEIVLEEPFPESR